MPRLIVWSVVAAVAGVCSLILPPYLTAGGLSHPAYGWPLIPWFSLAFANVRFTVSAICFFVVGVIFGAAQPARWRILALAATIVPPLLLAMTIQHDWKHDPTSHNLFPFELAIYGVLASPAWIGAYLGSWFNRVWQRRRAAE
jgi:hypothetical protein